MHTYIYIIYIYLFIKYIFNNIYNFIWSYICFWNSGVGISKEGLKNLFIDFSKLDENSKRNSQGTGLGLSICKKIIEKMGGFVNVKSTLN